MALRRVAALLISALALCAPSLSFAQGRDGVEKIDVFGGYSWYRPDGSIPAYIMDGKFSPGTTLPTFDSGWAGQFTYNLNHWASLAVDGTGHYNRDFGNIHSIAAGPQLRLRRAHFSAFGEALVGAQVFVPKEQPNESSTSFVVGGGIDYKVNSRFSVRPIQADYVNSYYSVFPGVSSNRYNGLRLQSGLVVSFGLPIAKVSAVCSIAPAAVEAGAPVTISVTARDFLPKHALSYSYESSGGKVSGTDATARVDTAGLAPGSYTVIAKVTSDRKRQRANCQTVFKVNPAPPAAAPAPPATAPAPPATAPAPPATAPAPPATAPAPPATAPAPPATAPAPPAAAPAPPAAAPVPPAAAPAPHAAAAAPHAAAPALTAKKYGTIGFQRDVKRPTRVDNEAKGELDRYADALAAAPDANGVLVGYAKAKETQASKGSTKVSDIAAQRAVNTKEYLTKEKGIDPARIEPRTASRNGQKVELWIVPLGATFSQAGTMVVDQAKVKAVPRVALKRKSVHRMKRKK